MRTPERSVEFRAILDETLGKIVIRTCGLCGANDDTHEDNDGDDDKGEDNNTHGEGLFVGCIHRQ